MRWVEGELGAVRSSRRCDGSEILTTTPIFQGPFRPRRLYLDLLLDLAENFLQHGFTRIFLLNGHGGNIIPGKQGRMVKRFETPETVELAMMDRLYEERQLGPPLDICGACQQL